MSGLTISDAFKALEEVEDKIDVVPVIKSRKSIKSLNEGCEKKKKNEDWEDLDEFTWDAIAEEIADKCNEKFPDANVKASDVFFDDSRAWSLYVDGSKLGLDVKKFGAWRPYLGGGMRGSIENNGRKQEETEELGDFFAEKLEEIENIINSGYEDEEDWDKPTGVLEGLEKEIGKNYRSIVLEDDGTETGGVSFYGETLGDFIDEVGSFSTLKELNDALKDCGIKTIKPKKVNEGKKLNERGLTRVGRDTKNEGCEKKEESCNLKEEPIYGLEPQYDSRKSFYGKAQVEVDKDGNQVLYSYSTPVVKIKKGGKEPADVELLDKWNCSPTTLRHVKDFLKQNGFKADSSSQIGKDYAMMMESRKQKKKCCESKELSEDSFDISNKDDVEKAKDLLNQEEEDSKEKIVDVDAETIDELKDSYIGNVILRCPVCHTLVYKKPDLLVKDEETETFNVEDECPHCGANDGYELVGQVASMDVEVDKTDDDTTGADIDVEKKEIDIEDNGISDEEIAKEQEDDFTFESFDGNSFSRLVNNYLHETYDNVDSFKIGASGIDEKNNIIFVEGDVIYTNGKSTKSRFVFEAKSRKDNKVKFSGLNETFTKARKPFTLIASNVNKNLMCESLCYNYKVNKQVIKGKIKL